jgi:murein L,D-transpeptidase YcbB/YkuD
MKNNVNESVGNEFLNRLQRIVVILSLLFSMLFAQTRVYAQSSTISARLSTQLNSRTNQFTLRFPKSVKRYYVQNQLKMVWIDKAQEKQTYEAMMLLDCVLQYGLAHADYHPTTLLYDNLQAMINEPEKISIEQRINFDIMLTDALITLINNLHYGKLNPHFQAKKLDAITRSIGFSAVAELARANAGGDFTAAILTVQPKSKAYDDLQRYMRLVKGQYVGDCYAGSAS